MISDVNRIAEELDDRGGWEEGTELPPDVSECKMLHQSVSFHIHFLKISNIVFVVAFGAFCILVSGYTGRTDARFLLALLPSLVFNCASYDNDVDSS